MKKIEDFEYLIGMTEDAAYSAYEKVRVIEEDGEHYFVTMDFKPERVNVIIEKGIITKIDGLY